MKLTTALSALTAAVLLSAVPATATPSRDTSHPATPNSCIELNRGDWNACNVGNGGAGDKPYRTVAGATNTPDACIARNRGDWNACNVGNGGAGDLPYLAPIR